MIFLSLSLILYLKSKAVRFDRADYLISSALAIPDSESVEPSKRLVIRYLVNVSYRFHFENVSYFPAVFDVFRAFYVTAHNRHLAFVGFDGLAFKILAVFIPLAAGIIVNLKSRLTGFLVEYRNVVNCVFFSVFFGASFYFRAFARIPDAIKRVEISNAVRYVLGSFRCR